MHRIFCVFAFPTSLHTFLRQDFHHSCKTIVWVFFFFHDSHDSDAREPGPEKSLGLNFMSPDADVKNCPLLTLFLKTEPKNWKGGTSQSLTQVVDTKRQVRNVCFRFVRSGLFLQQLIHLIGSCGIDIELLIWVSVKSILSARWYSCVFVRKVHPINQRAVSVC